MTQAALGLLVALGGLVGTVLLFRQTLLLRAQNAKLDLQTVTAEAQRRSGLSAELFSILQAVMAGESDAAQAEAKASGTELRRLQRGLTARIVAFSRAATRYWTAEVPDYTFISGEVPPPRLANRPRSPERGQLLSGLVTAGVDIQALVQAGATFADADLRGAVLPGADLRGADLSGADLRSAGLNTADLRGTILLNADLRGAQMRYAELRDADLYGTDVRGADLSGAIVGSSITPGRPADFPQAWSAPPEGWVLYEGGGAVRLRPIGSSFPWP